MDPTTDGDMAADGFVAAAKDILQTLTAGTRSKAQLAASELVSVIDGCQNSTEAQLSTVLDLLLKTQAQALVNKDLLSNSSAVVSECVDNQSTARQSLRETAGTAGEVLYTIETSKLPADEQRIQYVGEMNKRNEAFEDRLRADHEEFRQMHARRLASVLRQTQL
ncbi:hypothetical protein GGI21_002663 [Coemansia aciculifera]|nr:hypothetical protein GGI21_002663 [Coemansia aciculifera]